MEYNLITNFLGDIWKPFSSLLMLGVAYQAAEFRKMESLQQSNMAVDIGMKEGLSIASIGVASIVRPRTALTSESMRGFTLYLETMVRWLQPTGIANARDYHGRVSLGWGC